MAFSNAIAPAQTFNSTFQDVRQHPPNSTTTATITSLDAARQRSYYIELENNHPAWQQIAASWTLEGIIVTDDNTEQAGRMISGDMKYRQVIIKLHKHL